MKNRIRELRRIRGLTQADLAGAIDVSRQTIISIEADRYDPSLQIALRLSNFFSLPVEDIFKIGDL